MWLKFEKEILKIVRVMVRAVLKKRVSKKTRLRVLLLSKLKKKTIFKYLKKNFFIYNYNFFHTLLTMF